MFAVGDVVGTYTVLAHLRSGGMADLYLARREGAAGFRRLVAIKVIHPRHAQDEQLVRMFLDEALISARIDHPNVVHVEDLGQLDETYFLVMEYVHGCSLAQLMRVLGQMRRRLSPLVAVAIAARVAEGLHAAHETTDDEGQLVSLVHRDVSPQNILLSHKGHVKLIDFGVAKARLRSEETNVAMLKGKVRYMPPEQATTGLVDRRSDVYSLGIVLWEMLTMRRLFTGKTEFEILLKVRDPKVTPPSKFVPDVPAALDEVVLATLAADPDDRPQNAKLFRRMLASALPEAMKLDSAHLADLLLSVVGQELQETRNEFPEEVSRVLRAEQLRVAGLEKEERELTAPSAARSESVVEVMTVHSELAQFEVDDLDDTPDGAPAEEPDPRTRPGSPMALARSSEGSADLGALSSAEAARASIPTEEEADPTVVGDVPAHLRGRVEARDAPGSVDEEAETPRIVPVAPADLPPSLPAAALAPRAVTPAPSTVPTEEMRRPRPWPRAAPYGIALAGSILAGVVIALVLPWARGSSSTARLPPSPEADPAPPLAGPSTPTSVSTSPSPSVSTAVTPSVSTTVRIVDGGPPDAGPRPVERLRRARRWIRRRR